MKIIRHFPKKSFNYHIKMHLAFVKATALLSFVRIVFGQDGGSEAAMTMLTDLSWRA